ncbi:MAG: tRNA pseudouridine(55) synthase TruB [Nitrospinota bacterium]
MDGFINVFKDTGLASNSALTKIKKIIRVKKAGFLGTLDPVASGILPVALGRATKLLRFFEDSQKTYRATLRFGRETDTQDSTGKVTKEGPVPDEAKREELEKLFAAFTGEIKQLPPMFSAKKVDGERLYNIARKGGHVERDEKNVTVHSIKLEEFTGETAVFTAVVSKGTYIRALCEDIGRAFGYPAHMGELTREAVHNFTTKDCVTLEQLSEQRDDPDRWLLPPDYPLMFLPKFDAGVKDKNDLSNGMPVQWNGETFGYVRLYDSDGNFFGVGKGDHIIKKVLPEKIILSPARKEVSA